MAARQELLSREEERRLLRLSQTGSQEARDRLVNSNLGLVASIAKKYKGHSLSWDDLVQEGTIGLIEAIDNFNLSLDFRLSTYATYSISRTIVRAIDKTGHIIRLPSGAGPHMRRIVKAKRQLEQENGKTPTVESVATETGLLVRRVARLTAISVVSLDAPCSCHDGDPMAKLDVRADPNATDPFQVACDSEMSEIISHALRHFKPRERQILEKRYGLPPHERAHTLKEIAEEMGISREGVRYIQIRMLRALRLSFHLQQIEM